MKVYIEVIDHSKQRYNTCGDWQFIQDDLHIKISDTKVPFYNQLLAIHELIEATLCAANGVDEKMVDKWDLEHPNSLDPGSIPGCPYYREHMFATMIERCMAIELNVDWNDYEETLESL